MDVPPEIAFRGVDPTDTLKETILERIEDLEKAHQRLVSCRVVVENTTPSRTSGAVHRVHLEIAVPGRSPVVVNRKPAEANKAHDVVQAVEQAFDVAWRRIREEKRRQRGNVKTHPLPPHGRIVELLTNDEGVGYGFLLTGDGREVYFHDHALLDLDFGDLEVGMEVRFTEAAGRDGPQASSVSALDTAHVGRRQAHAVPLDGEPSPRSRPGRSG
jgi:cold shock CspA family protein/ribosome-associated translation inhibitor RaiA